MKCLIIFCGSQKYIVWLLPKGVRNALGNLMGMEVFWSSVNSALTPKQINRALNIAFGFCNESTPVFFCVRFHAVDCFRSKKKVLPFIAIIKWNWTTGSAFVNVLLFVAQYVDTTHRVCHSIFYQFVQINRNELCVVRNNSSKVVAFFWLRQFFVSERNAHDDFCVRHQLKWQILQKRPFRLPQNSWLN